MVKFSLFVNYVTLDLHEGENAVTRLETLHVLGEKKVSSARKLSIQVNTHEIHKASLSFARPWLRMAEKDTFN